MKQIIIYVFFPLYILFWLVIYVLVALRVYQRWIRQEIIYLIQMVRVTIDVYQKKNHNGVKSDVPSEMNLKNSMDLMLETEKKDGTQNDYMEKEKGTNNGGYESLDWEQVDI